MQAFAIYNNNLDTWDVDFYLKRWLTGITRPDGIRFKLHTAHLPSTSHISSLKRARSHTLSLYGKSPKWITHLGHPVWWFNIPITTKDELTQVCSDQNRKRGTPNVIQQTALKWRTAPWNKENSHREHQVFLSAKMLKVIDVFV